MAKSSKYKYVSFNKKTRLWDAYFFVKGKRKYLGLWDTEGAAHQKVQFYKKQIYG